MMSKKIVRICIGLIVIAVLLTATVAYTRNAQVPVLLQQVDSQVNKLTTQEIIYVPENSSQSIVQKIYRYYTEDGAKYSFNEDGQIISHTVADIDEKVADATHTYSEDSFTQEYVAQSLQSFIPNLNDFVFPAEASKAEYGYTVTLTQNADTVCENTIVVRFSFDGTFLSFNRTLCGIESEEEVDVSYFISELDKFLLDHDNNDSIIDKNFVYRKIGGTIVAVCGVTYQDPSGALYIEHYTFV